MRLLIIGQNQLLNPGGSVVSPVNKAGARSASVRTPWITSRVVVVVVVAVVVVLPSVQAAREKAVKRKTGGTGRGTSVTWCSMVSQPARLHRGNTKSQVSK